MNRSWVLVALFLVASVASAQTLKDLGTETGARVYWEPYRNVILLSAPSHRLAVDVDSATALGDGEKTFSLKGFDPVTGTLSRSDYQMLSAWWKNQPPPTDPQPVPDPPPASEPRAGGKRPHVQVLVLDPGHGGTDPGSIGRHTIDGKDVVLKEKDLTLAVVLELQKLLVAAYPNRNIVLTRKDDTYPTLERRVQIAHAQKLGDDESIFFLSVHFNASLNRKAHGLELWYVPEDYERDVLASGDVPDSVFPVLNTLVDSEYKKESHDLAVALAQGLSQELGDQNVQRGLKENPWFVVRMARMPAVLAELGFITNADEAAQMLDPEYLKKLAHGLYTGLVTFIQNYEDRR